MMVILKVAFISGSSKQGNIFRASVDCNWVAAKYLKRKFKINLTI